MQGLVRYVKKLRINSVKGQEIHKKKCCAECRRIIDASDSP